MYDALRYTQGCKTVPFVKVAYNAEPSDRWVLKQLCTLGLPWCSWGGITCGVNKFTPHRNLTNGVTYIQY
jgi:hypothetical protein